MKRMSRSQRQQAGVGSQQIQVAGNLVFGVTEERAVEIAREQSRIAAQEFTVEAVAEANARIENFREKEVSDLFASGLLTAFADPAFHIFLRHTPLHSASSSDAPDHEVV